MNRDDAFERCLEALYEAALDDTHWPAATTLIEEAVGIDGNLVGVSEGSGEDLRVLFTRWLRRGEDRQEQAREYFDVYYPHDEAVPRMARLPHGRLVPLRDLYSEDERKASQVYNEAPSWQPEQLVHALRRAGRS